MERSGNHKHLKIIKRKLEEKYMGITTIKNYFYTISGKHREYKQYKNVKIKLVVHI